MLGSLHLTKSYSSPFVLDKGKLVRISSVLQADTDANSGGQSKYTVTFRTGRRVALSSVDDVISLDNSSADPVTALEIESSRAGTNASITFRRGVFSDVSFHIYSGDNKLANQLYGELDEQLERTRVKTLMPRVAGTTSKLTLTVATIVILLLGFLTIVLGPPESENQSFNMALRQRALAARTDSEKLQIILDKTLRDLQPNEPSRRGTIDRFPFTGRALFMALPVAIVWSVFMYMVWTCYPWAVFAWGDGEQRYNDIVRRRQMLWTVVVVAILLGIVSNLFVASLPSLR